MFKLSFAFLVLSLLASTALFAGGAGQLTSLELDGSRARMGNPVASGEATACGIAKVLYDHEYFSAPGFGDIHIQIIADTDVIEELTRIVEINPDEKICGTGSYRETSGITQTLKVHLFELFEE